MGGDFRRIRDPNDTSLRSRLVRSAAHDSSPALPADDAAAGSASQAHFTTA